VAVVQLLLRVQQAILVQALCFLQLLQLAVVVAQHKDPILNRLVVVRVVVQLMHLLRLVAQEQVGRVIRVVMQPCLSVTTVRLAVVVLVRLAQMLLVDKTLLAVQV